MSDADMDVDSDSSNRTSWSFGSVPKHKIKHLALEVTIYPWKEDDDQAGSSNRVSMLSLRPRWADGEHDLPSDVRLHPASTIRCTSPPSSSALAGSFHGIRVLSNTSSCTSDLRLQVFEDRSACQGGRRTPPSHPRGELKTRACSLPLGRVATISHSHALSCGF